MFSLQSQSHLSSSPRPSESAEAKENLLASPVSSVLQACYSLAKPTASLSCCSPSAVTSLSPRTLAERGHQPVASCPRRPSVFDLLSSDSLDPGREVDPDALCDTAVEATYGGRHHRQPAEVEGILGMRPLRGQGRRILVYTFWARVYCMFMYIFGQCLMGQYV
jgi:hypothetical protein